MLDMVLVGNGPSALHWLAGQTIDKAIDVVRFNNFQIDGFEPFVGTRTTIWVRNDTQGIEPRNAPKIITVARPDRPQEGMLLPAFYDGGWASTGTTAALHFLERGRYVSLHGFDFFELPTHHYFVSRSKNRHHAPTEERRLLERFFQTGQLKLLQSPERTGLSWQKPD